jgi:ethanolamine utilization microcompartment shell protein EutS
MVHRSKDSTVYGEITMIGIENISKVTVSVGKIGSSISDALANGKIGLEDMPEGIEIMQVLPSLTSVKLADLIAEVKDLDIAEQEKVAQLFKDNFNIVNDNLEAAVEEGLDVLLASVKFFSRFIKKAEAPAA